MSTRLLLLMLLSRVPGGEGLVQEPRRPCTVEMPRGLPSPVEPGNRDCEVDRVARLRSDGRVEYTLPENLRSDWVCETVVMVFVVDTAGVPDPRTVRIEATTRHEWATAVLGSLATVRYRPALLAGRPVRQVVRYTRSALIPKVTFLSGSRISTASERWKRC